MKLIRWLPTPALAALTALGFAFAPAAASAHTRQPTARAMCAAHGKQAITVVLVHGAWAQPSSWNGEVSELQRAGCDVHAIGNPVQNLATDSETVADYVKTIPGPVLLVGHSYGGSVITNAADEPGVTNVVGLVYVDAAAPAVGETTASLSGSTSKINTTPMDQVYTTFPYPGAPAGANDTLLTKSFFLNDFAQNLPRAEATHLYEEQPPASTAALMDPSQYAAWQRLPSWYFISTGDQIITPQSELFMAHRAHSRITIFHGGSHLTLVSNPRAVTGTIAKALRYSLAHES